MSDGSDSSSPSLLYLIDDSDNGIALSDAGHRSRKRAADDDEEYDILRLDHSLLRFDDDDGSGKSTRKVMKSRRLVVSDDSQDEDLIGTLPASVPASMQLDVVAHDGGRNVCHGNCMDMVESGDERVLLVLPPPASKDTASAGASWNAAIREVLLQHLDRVNFRRHIAQFIANDDAGDVDAARGVGSARIPPVILGALCRRMHNSCDVPAVDCVKALSQYHSAVKELLQSDNPALVRLVSVRRSISAFPTARIASQAELDREEAYSARCAAEEDEYYAQLADTAPSMELLEKELGRPVDVNMIALLGIVNWRNALALSQSLWYKDHEKPVQITLAACVGLVGAVSDWLHRRVDEVIAIACERRRLSKASTTDIHVMEDDVLAALDIGKLHVSRTGKTAAWSREFGVEVEDSADVTIEDDESGVSENSNSTASETDDGRSEDSDAEECDRELELERAQEISEQERDAQLAHRVLEHLQQYTHITHP